jgi:hypothetical protein
MLENAGFEKLKITSGKKLVDGGYALEICEDWMNVLNTQRKTVLHGQKSARDGMYYVCNKCVVPEESDCE